jgi:DNA modification methylase
MIVKEKIGGLFFDLIKGDCLIENEHIKDGSVDLILTDLPYNITAAKWDVLIEFDKLWEILDRICKENTCICLFGNEPFSSALRMSNIKNYKYDWKWIKQISGNHLNAKKQPLRVYEDVCIFYKKQPTYNPILTDKPKSHIRRNSIDIKVKNNGVIGKVKENVKRNEFRSIALDKNYPNNVLNIDIMAKNKRIHPTQKPVELLEYLIKTFSNENDLVVDLTMGSGSTGVACKNTNRNFIGIEKDENYFNIAQKRIKGDEPNPNAFEKSKERGLFSFTDEPTKAD